MSAGPAGALLGALVGIALSVYVAVVDARRRGAGERSRAEYKASLVVVPALLALVGGLAGTVIAR